MGDRKRKAAAAAAEGEIVGSAMADALELQALRAWRAALLSPVRSEGAAFDMQLDGDKLLLAQALWLGGYVESMKMLRPRCNSAVQATSFHALLL